jgi:hypothetical protein
MRWLLSGWNDRGKATAKINADSLRDEKKKGESKSKDFNAKGAK